VLTFATFYRPGVLQLSSEQRTRSLPLSNPIKRSYTLDLIEHGFESQYFPQAVARFRTLLYDMERTLSRSAWLVGGEYSLADADFTPYLRRLEDLGVWELAKGLYPNVARWFAQVQARPSYKTAMLDWITPEDDQRDKLNAAAAKPYLASAWSASER
jgi:glutathione S-transferase